MISEFNFVKSTETVCGTGAASSRAKKYRSCDEFLTHVETKFEEIVIGGLESRLRGLVYEKLVSHTYLLGAEN